MGTAGMIGTPLFAGRRRGGQDRPNILWITSEDNSPLLGCYGDKQAHTPSLDRLAREGVRYRNAFANPPVCSAARSTLITGMYACSVGLHNHRSKVRIPESFRSYPEYMRESGYYCTNNSKMDYNFVRKGAEAWDESSKKAHYDNMTLMDEEVGRLLKELVDKGLADDTIVFYYADHGGALPRGKRNIHDSGTRVPFIMRFPKKWAHLAPADPGEWVDQPVSFVDFPATAFSLMGVPIPKHFEGRAFLGEQTGKLRDHVFLFRGRMDERYDTVRAVRDRHYRYVQNYSPHRPWGQQYSYPFRVMPSMGSWYQAYVDGKCNPAQARYWKPKPSQEFYEIESDPYEVKNLIDDPKHAAKIAQMRETLKSDIVRTCDTGFIPEGMFERLSADKTLYEYAQSDAYPIERIVDVANMAASRDASALRKLIAACDDPHPVIRYWGTTGCLILQKKASPAKRKLKDMLTDDWHDVRVVAAEALGYLGETDLALETMESIINGEETFTTVAALNALDYMMQARHVSVKRIQEMVKGKRFKNVSGRMVDYFNAMT